MAGVVAFLLGTVAYGAWQGYGGQQVDVNALRQFQKETLPMRDELQAKGLELRNESLKESPDQARIAKLRGEIGDLRARIQSAAEEKGLPGWGYGGGMRGGYWGGRGCGMRGPAWGYGRMMGDGYDGRGYGRGGCPMWY